MDHGVASSRLDADAALTTLYTAHYRPLVRTAGLLTRDRSLAEEVVQDAFIGLYRNWSSVRDPERALAYLRKSTVNGARSALRRQGTAERAAPKLRLFETAADPAESITWRRSVIDALAALPERQREVLVLRYYADLDEAAIADVLGISKGSVKTHASRGLAALRPVLEGSR